jgi:hypothetical protein
VSAFRTTEAGVCGAGCGQPVDAGDLVVWINDAMVHLECEDPEKAIAAEPMGFDVDDNPRTHTGLVLRDLSVPDTVPTDLVRILALDIANAVDNEYGAAEVTPDEDLTPLDLAIGATVYRGSAIAGVKAGVWREAATFLERRGLLETRDIFLARAHDLDGMHRCKGDFCAAAVDASVSLWCDTHRAGAIAALADRMIGDPS